MITNKDLNEIESKPNACEVLPLVEELRAARAEVEYLKRQFRSDGDHIIYLTQQLDAARAALAARDDLLSECLRRLKTNTDHTPECLAEYEKPCHCGRADFLQRIEAALGEG